MLIRLPSWTSRSPLARATVKGAAWSAAGSAATQLLQLAVGVLLARLLGREAFGLLSMAMIVTGLAAMVGEAGLGPVIVQRRDMTPRLLATLFWAGLALGFGEAVLLWITAPAVSAALRQPELVGVLRGCSVALLLGPLGLVPRWLLTRDLGFRSLVRIEVLAAILGAAAAVGLALAGAGVMALVARVGVTAAAAAALAWTATPWRPTLQWDGAALRSVLPYGRGIVGTQFLNQAAQNIDFVLIGRYLGAAPLGEYGLAYTLATLPQGRLTPVLARVMFPVFSRVQEDEAALRRGYTRFVAVIALISFPLLTALGVLGPTVLPLIYGSEWREAAAPLPALCLAGAFYALSTTVGSLFRAKGRPDLELKTTAVRALLLVGCVTAGLIFWGTTRGVALAVAFYAVSSTLAFQPVANSLIRLPMRAYLAALTPAAAASAAMALVMLAAHRIVAPHLTTPLSAVLALSAGSLVYLALLALWQRTARGSQPESAEADLASL